MTSTQKTYTIGAIIVALLVIGGIYFASQSSQPTDMATTTDDTTVIDTATTTDNATTSTSTPTSSKPKSSAHMSASDFKLFIEGGRCKEVAHSKALDGYRAIDFSRVTISPDQAAWLCRDGEYYTNN